MIKKNLAIASLLTLFSIGVSFFMVTTAHAEGEAWYWDGTNNVVGTGGVFAKPVQFNPKNANSTTGSKYTADVSYLNIPSGYSVEDEKIPCRVTTVEIEIDRNARPNTVKVTRVDEKKQPTAYGMDACATSTEMPEALITGGAMRNSLGENLADTSQAEALEAERKRLQEEYVNQQCGQNPTPDCRATAGQSFSYQWNGCLNSYSNVTDTDLRLKSMTTCVKKATGLEIDTQAVGLQTLEIPNYEREKSSCSLQYIGYIVCPVMRFMALMTDAAYDSLQNFLEVKSLNRGTEGGDSLYVTWAAMRNIANVLFVVAFMVVIYSQITGAGVSNYGIKKLLPRIIVAAILVNVSYYLCVLAVELINVLGASIKTVLDGIANGLNQTQPEERDTWESITRSILAPALALSVTAATVTSAALYLSFASIVPILTTVLLSLLMVVLLLAARYAAIIILIIIAPIALVAFLLPNTQKWFSKWTSMFTSLLLLYPLISLLYGMGTLASSIVMGSGGGSTTTATLLPMIGLALEVLPLILTLFVIRAGAGVMRQVSGRLNNNGLFKAANNKAQGYAKRKKDARDLAGLQHTGAKSRKGLTGARDKVIQRRYKRDALRSIRQQQMHNSSVDYLSSYTSEQEGSGGEKATLYERAKAGVLNRNKTDDDERYIPTTRGEKYRTSLAAGGGDGADARALANALNVQLSMYNEEVKASKMTISKLGTAAALRIAKGETTGYSEADRQAAIEFVAENMGSDIDEVVKASGTTGTTGAPMTDRQRHALVKSIDKSGSSVTSPYYSSPTARENILRGNVTTENFTEQVVAPSIQEGRMSVAQLASAEGPAMENIREAVAGVVERDAAGNVRTAADGSPIRRQIVSDESADALRGIARAAVGDGTAAHQGNKYATENMATETKQHLQDLVRNVPPPTNP